MFLFAFGLSILILPVWVFLLVLKFVGVVYVCEWKYLLIPFWLLLMVIAAYAVFTIGFISLFFLIHALI